MLNPCQIWTGSPAINQTGGTENFGEFPDAQKPAPPIHQRMSEPASKFNLSRKDFSMIKFSRILTATTAAIMLGTGLGTVTPAFADSSGDRLVSGGTLSSGDWITSPNGAYQLVMRADGNLVEYAVDLLPTAKAGGFPPSRVGFPGSQPVAQAVSRRV